MITKILNGLKRILFGSTYKFTTRKGSTSLSGASWVPILTERTETPVKLISIEFITEKDIIAEYRIVVNGDKTFPFADCSQIKSQVTGNFLIPVEVAVGEYLQVEVRGGINTNNVIILNELAVIEVV